MFENKSDVASAQPKLARSAQTPQATDRTHATPPDATVQGASSPGLGAPDSAALRDWVSENFGADEGRPVPEPRDIARQGLQGSASRLPHFEILESAFGQPLGEISAYSGTPARQAAAGLHAHAYAHAGNVVLGDKSDLYTVAEETAHALQQRKTSGTTQQTSGVTDVAGGIELEAASAAHSVVSGGSVGALEQRASSEVVARQPVDGQGEWNEIYKDTQKANDPEHQIHTYLGKSVEEAKAMLDPSVDPYQHLKNSSELSYYKERQGQGTAPGETPYGKGTPVAYNALSMADLKKVYPQFAADAEKDPDRAQKYLERVHRAFELTGIDTAEAQAAYLGHAYVESNQFSTMTETQNREQAYGDATQINLDAGDLNSRSNYQTEDMAPVTKENGEKDWQQSFIGRGPLQVTGRSRYVETIAFMEKKAEQFKAQNNPAAADELMRAANAVKADPRQAANPEYAFLFSASYMKMGGGDAGGDVRMNAPTEMNFSGGPTDESTSYMSGGAYEKPQNAAAKKNAYYTALSAIKQKDPEAPPPPAADGPGCALP